MKKIALRFFAGIFSGFLFASAANAATLGVGKQCPVIAPPVSRPLFHAFSFGVWPSVFWALVVLSAIFFSCSAVKLARRHLGGGPESREVFQSGSLAALRTGQGAKAPWADSETFHLFLSLSAFFAGCALFVLGQTVLVSPGVYGFPCFSPQPAPPLDLFSFSFQAVMVWFTFACALCCFGRLAWIGATLANAIFQPTVDKPFSRKGAVIEFCDVFMGMILLFLLGYASWMMPLGSVS